MNAPSDPRSTWDGESLLSPRWVAHHGSRAFVVVRFGLSRAPAWARSTLSRRTNWCVYRKVLYLDQHGRAQGVGQVWMTPITRAIPLLWDMITPPGRLLGITIERIGAGVSIRVLDGPHINKQFEAQYWSGGVPAREVRRRISLTVRGHPVECFTEEALACFESADG